MTKTCTCIVFFARTGKRRCVSITSKMMIGKLFIAILFCLSMLNTVCKGAPSSLEEKNDYSSTTASSSSDSNDVGTVVFQSIPQKTGTGVPYKRKEKTFDLLKDNQRQSEASYATKTQSILNENDIYETVKEPPTPRIGEKSRPTRHGKPRVTGDEWPSPHGIGMSTVSHMAAVRPGKKIVSEIRWNLTAYQESGDENAKGKRKKKTKKSADSNTGEDPVSLSSWPIVTGILAGILVLLFSVTGLLWLWREKNLQKHIDSELTSMVIVSSTADLEGELSDGEVVFEEKTVVFKNKGVKSFPPQGPKSNDLDFQDMLYLTEFQPWKVLVKSASLMSLSRSVDIDSSCEEDWKLAEETSPESPRTETQASSDMTDLSTRPPTANPFLLKIPLPVAAKPSEIRRPSSAEK